MAKELFVKQLGEDKSWFCVLFGDVFMDSTKGKSLLKSLFGEKRTPGCLGFLGG